MMAPSTAPINSGEDDVYEFVVVTVEYAELTKNFEKKFKPLAKMDPYAIITFFDEEKKKVLESRTKTHWNAHKTPKFDHDVGHNFSPNGYFEIAFFEDGSISKPEPMGTTAKVKILQLVNAQSMELPISYLSRKSGGLKPNGFVKVSAKIVETSASVRHLHSSRTEELSFTKIDPSLFRTPVKRIGVSGGTAPFFALEYLNGKVDGKSPSYYIGKDLSRAMDEVDFYELMLAIVSSNAKEGGLRDLLSMFAFDYFGVLESREEGAPESDPVLQMLVLRNLRDGHSKLRLLDIKVGEKTADAGWKGKTWSHAVRQSMLDKRTNSDTEGFRLEGFDSPPPTLEFMDPLLDRVDSKSNPKMAKKARRMNFQQMRGSEMLMHFLDIGTEIDDSVDVNLEDCLHYAEVTEIVLHEIVKQLAKLDVVLQHVQVPQKWIGSSCAIGFDCGCLPLRSESESKLRSNVIVNIFDWGKSELNTLEQHNNLTPEEQLDRKRFWGYYKSGLERLGWVAAGTYFHRFGNSNQWDKITFSLYDFDAMSSDDFMAQVVVPVEETERREVELDVSLKGHVGPATISYSIKFCEFPPQSRLKGTWIVSVYSGKNLPNLDEGEKSKGAAGAISDPYCIVKAVSRDENHSFQQITKVVPNDLNPVWNQSFYFPIARNESATKDSLEYGKIGLGKGDLSSLFPADAGGGTPLSGISGLGGKSSIEKENSFLSWTLRLEPS